MSKHRDRSVSCSACEAVCCRLTVVLAPPDDVPREYVVYERGLAIMARGEDGWCLALDREHRCCGIYDQRPSACRRFVMGGAYCQAERAEYAAGVRRIPIAVLP